MQQANMVLVVATTLISLSLILLSLTLHRSHHHPTYTRLFPHYHHRHQRNRILTPPPPPSLAYLLSGGGSSSPNDTSRIIRLLHSIYHPKNHYLIHLHHSADQSDRHALAAAVQSVPLFRAVGNVHVIGKADCVLPDGPSSLSSTLHGLAVLLRLAADWDWFISLSTSDYPLVTQDDLLHVLSYLPKELNFVNHTSYIGWRESRKLKPIVVDLALSLVENSEIFYATEKRQLPDAFRLFTGSSAAILSREFAEFCILGTDNLPRTLLMYVSNSPAPTSVYFPTVLCNSHRFNRTTINHSLHYASLDSRHRAQFLNSSNFDDLITSGAAFASPFHLNDPVLDRIDQELLGRSPGKVVPGGWCLGDFSVDKCSVWGDADVLKPGPGAKRLEKRLVEVLSSEITQSRQCVDE